MCWTLEMQEMIDYIEGAYNLERDQDLLIMREITQCNTW